MSFDREKYEKALHDAGGAFASAKQAERVIKDCGGDVKGIGPRVVERVRGHVTKLGHCVEAVTAIEGELVLDERRYRKDGQPTGERNVTRNGPHEFIEYVPIQGK